MYKQHDVLPSDYHWSLTNHLSAVAPEAWSNLWQNGWQTPSLLDPKASFKPSPPGWQQTQCFSEFFLCQKIVVEKKVAGNLGGHLTVDVKF